MYVHYGNVSKDQSADYQNTGSINTNPFGRDFVLQEVFKVQNKQLQHHQKKGGKQDEEQLCRQKMNRNSHQANHLFIKYHVRLLSETNPQKQHQQNLEGDHTVE